MERKRVIDMTSEEMAKYSIEELDSMMTEDYEYAVKQMKQEYDAARKQMIERINKVRSNTCNMEKENELPGISFDLHQAHHIIHLIREQLRKSDDSGLIEYKYLPDKKRDKLFIFDPIYFKPGQIGGFQISDMYNNILHSVFLYSDGTVAYSHYVPNHVGIGTKYYPDKIVGWYRYRWSLPADEVWDLIPKLDPK